MSEVIGAYVPNWIMAVATVLGLIAAGGAAFFAWRTLTNDKARALRAQAQLISAWWATDPPETPQRRWGVLVVNRSTQPVFDFSLHASGNRHPRAGDAPVIRMLPPGASMICVGSPDTYAWSIQSKVNDENLQPLSYSKEHSVDRFEFTDAAGVAWRWAPASGLRESVSPSNKA